MSEYNYNYNNQQNPNNNGENYNGFSTDSTEAPKKKKHTGLKITAFIMAMAVVSGGSIGIYRHFAGENLSGDSVIEELEDDAESTTKQATRELLASKAVSLIKPEEIGGSALSNEEIVEKVLPSVVGIESTFTTEQTIGSNFGDIEDFFDFGFGFGNGFGGSGRNSEPVTREFKGTGTGVIISENGYIVTNAHVIYDSEYGGEKATSVSVVVNDDDYYDAEIIGYDTDCDLAVLKIDETGLTAAEFGNSDELKLGESVIAIGNPLGFELMDTVTGGMVSGLNRNITINDKAMNLIQTDAAINSGNSGGPLINKYGQVIGINSSKMSSSYSSSGASIEGIGFAIPSNETASIIDDLMKFGYVTGKPQLGISCQPIDEVTAKMYNWPTGVYVFNVNKGSAAEKAGLKKGDIIVKADGEKVTSTEELIGQMSKHSAGEEFEITFVRDDEEKTVKVTLDEKIVEKTEEEDESSESKSKKSSKAKEETDEQDEAEEEEETTTKKSKSDKAEKTEKTEKSDKSAEAADEEE
ncbi:trypsin-like peptidase domain-containing protein [Ruminococcus sp.]|uniref:S1C family serine protease n=1 Tax=Ruminococcus sp. TaxID=41978 RepID=UPI0025DD8C8A|nr:trypsin-like peptidase domain-containing protein [Ruminococcus sp.]MCR4639454.1 trypsin-like peptidase domain-containing protein [Ruminococcus sp.]